MLLIPFWLACADPPLAITAEATPDGVHVDASAAVDEVEVVDAAGVPVSRKRLLEPSMTVEVPVDLLPGRYEVRARSAGRAVSPVHVEVVAAPPVRVQVQLVPGRPWEEGAGTLVVPLPDGAPADVLVSVTAGRDHPAQVSWSGGPPIPLDAPGRRVVRKVRVGRPMDLVVGDVTVHLEPVVVSLAEVRSAIRVGSPAFPAGPDGVAEPARTTGRIPLPSPVWQRLLRRLGLGIRARDPWAPWSQVGLELTNDTADPVDLVVSAEVLRDGVVDSAFRPRVRGADGDTGVVSVLARLPAHAPITVVLPVFVDEAEVSPGEVTLVLTTRALGSEVLLHRIEQPLVVTRGNGLAGAGFVASCLVCAAGIGWMMARMRTWLNVRSTTELMTIALFGAGLFVVGGASDLISMSVGALLGPFSPVVVGILADVGRTALLGTLLTLYPRPGTLALAITVGWLGRSFLTGGFTPIDVLYAGASVGYGEAFAWLSGLSRSPDWREGTPFARWLRLSVAFGGASMLGTLSGLWMHIVLFRLYFATWYLVLQTLVPGLLYVLLAAALTVPFAASLRRVEP